MQRETTKLTTGIALTAPLPPNHTILQKVGKVTRRETHSDDRVRCNLKWAHKRQNRCKTSLWRHPMCTLHKVLARAHISMLHDRKVSPVIFWVVLAYSTLSVFYTSCGLHSGDEVVHFSRIHWILSFSKRLQKTLKSCPSLQSHFTQLWELSGPKTRWFAQAHQIQHSIEMKVASARVCFSKTKSQWKATFTLSTHPPAPLFLFLMVMWWWKAHKKQAQLPLHILMMT